MTALQNRAILGKIRKLNVLAGFYPFTITQTLMSLSVIVMRIEWVTQGKL